MTKYEDNISVTVNGQPKSVPYNNGESLMRALRRAGHTEIKHGCDEGVCGSCNVLRGGVRLANSCTVQAGQCDGDEITTAKGVTAEDGSLHPVQEEFLDHGAAQCGFCIPGIIVTAYQLLERNPNPSEVEIRQALEGNLCRCTGYVQQIEAIRQAADRLPGHERGGPVRGDD